MLDLPRTVRQALTLVIVFLATAVAVSFVKSLLPKSMGEGRAVLLPISSSAQVKPMGENFVAFDGKVLSLVTSSGSRRWSVPLEVPGGELVTGSKLIAVVHDTQLSLFDDQGRSLYTGRMQSEILELRLGEGRAAMLSQGDAPVIRVITSDGMDVDAQNFPGDTVIDFGFYDADMLWVNRATLGSAQVFTTISTYQPAHLSTATITISDELIYRSVFNKNHLMLVGTRNVTYCDNTKTIAQKSKTLVYGWQAVASALNKDVPYAVLAPSEQLGRVTGVDELRVVDAATSKTHQLPESCATVFATHRGVTAVARDAAYVLPHGEEKFKPFRLRVPVEHVRCVTNEGCALIESGGALYALTL